LNELRKKSDFSLGKESSSDNFWSSILSVSVMTVQTCLTSSLDYKASDLLIWPRGIWSRLDSTRYGLFRSMHKLHRNLAGKITTVFLRAHALHLTANVNFSGLFKSLPQKLHLF